MEFGTKLWLHDVSDYHRVLDALDSRSEIVFKDRICYTDFFFDFVDHSLTSSQAVLRLRVPFATEYSPTILSPIYGGNNFDEHSHNYDLNQRNNNQSKDNDESGLLENDNACTGDFEGDDKGRSINEYCATLLEGVNRHNKKSFIHDGKNAHCWSNASGVHRSMLINQASSTMTKKGNISLKRNRSEEELQEEAKQENNVKRIHHNNTEATAEGQKSTKIEQNETSKNNNKEEEEEEEEEEYEHVEPAELVYKSGNTVGDGEQISFTIKSKKVPQDVVQRLLSNTDDPFSILAEYACSVSTFESLDTAKRYKNRKKGPTQISCTEKESMLEIVNKLCELAPSKKKCNVVLQNLLTKHNQCVNTESMARESADKSDNSANNLIELERCNNINDESNEEYDWILIPVGSYTTTRKVYECRLPLTNKDKSSWQCTKGKNSYDSCNDLHESTENYLTVRVDKTIFPFGERYEMESLPSSQLLNDVKEMLEAFLIELHVKFTPASESKYVRFVIGNASRSAPQQEVQDVKLRITSKEGYDEMRDNLMSSDAFTRLGNRAKFCNNSSYATTQTNNNSSYNINTSERRLVMSSHVSHKNAMSNRYTNAIRGKELAPFAENRAANYLAEYNANDVEEQNYINNKNTIAILKNKLNYTNTTSNCNTKDYETKEEEIKEKVEVISGKENRITEESTEQSLSQLQNLESQKTQHLQSPQEEQQQQESANTQHTQIMKGKNNNNGNGDYYTGDEDDDMMTFEEEYHEDFFFDGSHHELAEEHGFLRLRRFGHGQFFQLVLKRKQKFVEGKQENYTCKTQVGEDVALLLLSGNPTRFLIEQHSCNAVAEMLWNSCGLRTLIPTVHFATHRLIVPWWSAESQVPTLARDYGTKTHINNKHTSNTIMAHSTRSVNTLNTCSIAMQTSLTSETLNYLNTQHSQTSEPLSLSQNTNVVEPLRIHLDRTIYEIPVISNDNDNVNDEDDTYVNNTKRNRSVKEMSEEIKRSIDRNMQLDFCINNQSENEGNKTEIVEYEMPNIEESENAQKPDLHGSVNVMKSRSVSHANLQPTQISPVPRRVRSESVTHPGDSANISQSPQPVQVTSQINDMKRDDSHNLHMSNGQATRTVELFELEVTNITHTTPSEVMNELVSKLYKLGIEWNPGTESKLDYYYHLPQVEHAMNSVQRSTSLHKHKVEESNSSKTYKGKRQISVTLRASTQRV